MAVAQNATALQKVSSSDFSAGGQLSPEQFNQFFEDVMQEAGFLSDVNRVTVSAESGQLPRLSVGSRLIRAVAENDRTTLKSINQPDVPFDVSKVSLPWELTHEAATQNIVGQSIEAQIRQMFVQQMANDLEILGSIGDTADADPFVGIQDGWITTAQNRGAPTYDHASASVNKALFSQLKATLPEEHRQAGGLVYITSDAQKQEFKEYLTDRSSGAGDQMLMTGDEPTPYGVDIRTPLGWPDDMAMMVNPQNLIYVVNDDLRVKQTTEGEHATLDDVEVIYNLLSKIDYTVLDEAGVALATNIAAPA